VNRLEVILLSFYLLLISLFGITNPHNSFEWLMGAFDGLDALRIILAMVLLSFSIFGPQGNETGNQIFRIAGLFMFGLLAGNALFPGLYQQANIHLLSLDIVGFVEGSIVCILYSLNEPLDAVVTSVPAQEKKNAEPSITKPA
jgi:hypothetical protein